jgi:hypothetical protein
MVMRGPTSIIVANLLRDAPSEHVTLEWIVDRLGERSFGIVMLLIALIGLVPVVSWFAGLLVAVPAVQMIIAHQGPVLPNIIARRRIPTPRLVRLIERTVPVLRRIERLVRPWWVTPFKPTKPVVGFIILLLCATIFYPIPFIHVIPLLVIMLLAFAFLEEDGVILCIALFAAVISLSIIAALIWSTVEAVLLF